MTLHLPLEGAVRGMLTAAGNPLLRNYPPKTAAVREENVPGRASRFGFTNSRFRIKPSPALHLNPALRWRFSMGTGAGSPQFALSIPVREHHGRFCILYRHDGEDFREIARLLCDGHEFENAQVAALRSLHRTIQNLA